MEGIKIILLDCETGPNLSYTWGKWEQNVLAFEEEWKLLCFGYKWLGEKITTVLALPDFKNEKGLIRAIWKLLDECDITIAHNGNAFDLKKLNAKFIEYGFGPPSPYRTIDTLKVARKYFAFNGNKLGDLGPHLNLGAKVDHIGFKLWLGCIKGDKESWRVMKKYNKQDVVLLEKVYNKFLPWISTHPSLDNYSKTTVCAHCGSKNLQRRGYYHGNTTQYRHIYCKDCMGWSKIPLNLQEKRPLTSI